jgi:hypothetical protein
VGLIVKKRAAILQSNYIPWKGYFHIMRLVDEFVLYDDVQFTKNDWRNRNKIKTPKGLKWLTIPIPNKISHMNTKICEVEIQDNAWAEKHWELIRASYNTAPHFRSLAPAVEKLYGLASKERHLSRINFIFLRGIADILGIPARLTWSMDYDAGGVKTDRLLEILKKSGATVYLSGPSAKNYIEEDKFKDSGIELRWMRYEYPEYPQLYPPFEHGVTVLDTLFHIGVDIFGGECPHESRDY